MVPEHHRGDYCGHHGISKTERKEGVIMFDQVDLYVSMGISILLSTIKNPAKAAQFKRAFLKVRDAINAAYPGE